ncbi:MAG: hypothetical protein P1P76_00750 [Anaerolineales bacterium]|nr:hypothetical protein [Anaerolineales bacterium]
MNNTAISFNQIIRLTFWRIVAWGTGKAVKNQKMVERALWVTPLALAAVLAYVLGRLVGSLLLWGFA